MATEEQVNVVFGATTDAFVSHVAQIREILQGLSNPLRGLRTNLGEIAEAFAAAFAIEKISQFIEKISEMGAEVEHASHELGMSTEQVTTLTAAFSLMGISTESGVFSLVRLERSMSAAQTSAGPASQAFRALGIPLDQLKNMKPEDVLNRMADVFSHTADGANKTAIAIALFGRAGARMIPFLDEGREGLERFAQVAEDTGTRMSGPMAHGMEETAQSIATLGLAVKGVSITIYEAFKPAIDATIEGLIELVEDFNNAAKSTGIMHDALTAIVVIVDLVIGAFALLSMAAQEMWQLIAGIIEALAARAMQVYGAVTTFFTEGPAEVGRAWDEAGAHIEENWNMRTEHMKEAFQGFVDTVHKLMSNLGKEGVDTSGENLQHRAATPKPGSMPQAPSMEKLPKEERMADLEAELHREEMGWQIHWDQLKEFEAAFWAGMLEKTDKGAKDYNAIFNKMFSSQEALAHEHVTKEAAREAQATATAKTISDTKLKEEKEVLDQSVEIGTITNFQKIAKLKELTEAAYQEDLKRLQNELYTEGQLPDYYQKVNDKILVMQAKHDNDMAGLNRQAVIAQLQPWDDMVNVIKTSMDTMLSGVLTGTQTFTQAMKNLWNNLILSLIEYEAKLLITKASNGVKALLINNQELASWIGLETEKTATSEAGAQTRAAADAEAQSAGIVAAVAQGKLIISNDAFEAAAGAYAATAAIPLIGPELAPEAAAKAFGDVMAFDLLSAAQGMVVPTGLSPLVRLHQKEMVLPAPLSEGVQNMISGGKGGGLGGGDTTINVNVAGSNATPDQIARAVSQAVRDFHPAFRR